MIYSFSASPVPTLKEVGGKGLSLILATQAGLPVPPGFVLSVAFFEPWFERLRSLPEWEAFAGSAEASLERRCSELKAAALGLSLTPSQRGLLQQHLAGNGSLWAVRSSSPEEDLVGCSFAGGYETVLGVVPDTLEEALRRAFASCLDYRVAVYKRQHGFDVHCPRIAVVVQRQIASDVAGVGFSLNPLTNDYDEAVINANWGLGETVVSGLATPDSFTIERTAGKVLERRLGGKETSIVLSPDGGTQARPDARRGDYCLTEEQAVEVARLITSVEGYYRKPIDIEWAYSGGELFLLQARPITTHVPLPAEMITAPGEKRRLYLDISISVQGLLKPLSPMGISALSALFSEVCQHVFGQDISREVPRALLMAREGRLYFNLSNVFAIVGQEKFCKGFEVLDPTVYAALADTDEHQYRSDDRQVRKLPLKALWRLPESGVQALGARLAPEHALANSQHHVELYRQEAHALMAANLPLGDFARQLLKKTVHLLFVHTIPLFATSRVAHGKMKTMFGESEQEAVASLDRSLPGNLTVEMGLTLHDLSQLIPRQATLEDLQAGLADGSLPEPFLVGWAQFLERFGHRGPAELDLASPRYRDDPGMLLQQLVQLRSAPDGDEGPRAVYERNQRQREETFQRLLPLAGGWVQRKRFASLYHVLKTLGGLREAHKYNVILALDLLRTRIRREAEQLAAAGRLEAPEQVFDLTLDDLEQGLQDASVDLRARGARNRELPDRLARLPELPRLIDSRGRILRPKPAPAREGETVGTPISPGRVMGPIKVLHAPDEKPVEPGDILVARATDPGWTPLFVNAAAVILEVGGMLQHGALVAREYGKPCVAGVERATELWADGTRVEVDGSAGVVRLVGQG